jgi:hypothetical protein
MTLAAAATAARRVAREVQFEDLPAEVVETEVGRTCQYLLH